MITVELLKSISEQINANTEILKHLENKQVAGILQYFGIPEKKSPNIISIEELLEFDTITALFPSNFYKEIDFSKFKLPNKIVFRENTFDNYVKFFGFDKTIGKTTEFKIN